MKARMFCLVAAASLATGLGGCAGGVSWGQLKQDAETAQATIAATSSATHDAKQKLEQAAAAPDVTPEQRQAYTELAAKLGALETKISAVTDKATVLVDAAGKAAAEAERVKAAGGSQTEQVAAAAATGMAQAAPLVPAPLNAYLLAGAGLITAISGAIATVKHKAAKAAEEDLTVVQNGVVGIVKGFDALKDDPAFSTIMKRDDVKATLTKYQGLEGQSLVDAVQTGRMQTVIN